MTEFEILTAVLIAAKGQDAGEQIAKAVTELPGDPVARMRRVLEGQGIPVPVLASPAPAIGGPPASRSASCDVEDAGLRGNTATSDVRLFGAKNEAHDGQSSYQRLLEAMPGTARRLYALGRSLAALNPNGGGRFDLGSRGAAIRLGCGHSTAGRHLKLHETAGVWTVVTRGALRGRRGWEGGKESTNWQIVPLSELDFETAIVVYQGHRAAMRARAEGIRTTAGVSE